MGAITDDTSWTYLDVGKLVSDLEEIKAMVSHLLDCSNVSKGRLRGQCGRQLEWVRDQ